MSSELEADMSPKKRLRDAENEAEAATGSQEGERGAVDVVGDRLTPPWHNEHACNVPEIKQDEPQDVPAWGIWPF